MQRRVLGILFAVLFIVMVGFSVLFPVEPYYVRTFGATSRTMGWLLASYSLAHFICSPAWGRLSDRIGRKPVMMTGLGGYAVAMIWFGLADSIPALFGARTLAGILSAATLPTAMAVVADTTGNTDRTKGMGILGAAFGLGVIFGPFIGGTLGSVDMRLPFFLAAGLSFVALLMVAALLPESLRPGPDQESQAPDVPRRAVVNRETIQLYAVALLVTVSLAGLETAFPFLANDRLGLDARSVGYVYAVMGLVGAGVQAGVVGRLQEVLAEERMIQLGLVLSIAGMAGIAIAPSPVIATIAISAFAAGHGLIRPANASLVSQRTTAQHGLAIGLLDSAGALGRIVGPIAGGSLYAIQGSLPFIAGAGLNALALISFLTLYATLQQRHVRDPVPS